MQKDRSWTEIDLDNFTYNISELKKFIGRKSFMQIVKADAYGHGGYQIAKKALELGAVYLGVANAEEGTLLRFQGITSPILILSPSLTSEIPIIIENNLTPTVSTLRFAMELNKQLQDELSIHVNIDTGMGRSGFNFKNAAHNISKIKKLDKLNIIGVFSHYSAAEDDSKFTEKQTQLFSKVIQEIDILPRFVHIENSSGAVNAQVQFTNLVRIGLLSYGIYADRSLQGKIDLKPVMRYKTKISQIKIAEKGDSIGYNRTFIAPKKMKYAILPVGYADGYDFMLSNKALAVVNNQLCPILGKISMDMSAVDVSQLEKVNLGDEVMLLGNNFAEIRAENLTALYGGSAYEILCQIGRRAKRYYKQNGKIIASSPFLRRDFVPSDFSNKKLTDIIETAIEHRLQSKEIANLIYEDVLKRFFSERDRDIHYRRKFRHTIEFMQPAKPEFRDYFLAKTTLRFSKKLQHDYFYVACAPDEAKLEQYFRRTDVEYRWLLNSNLDTDQFKINSVQINGVELDYTASYKNGCLEIRCQHEKLAELVGQEVEFSISTSTYYPKSSHQLSVYLIELTQGVDIRFIFGDILQEVEAVPIFSGRSKFPQITEKKGEIRVQAQPDEWVFPSSGVVFVY
ncbi:MAG: alanine racemase [Candidatus Cloacimonadota bacterium]|nr:alanine racemase [Candidatus Cloacimonadota bacterium]